MKNDILNQIETKNFESQLITSERAKWHFANKTLKLSEAIGKPETQEMIYSIKVFKELYETLFTVHNADGVRIYIAAYPEQSDDVLVPTGKENTLTIVYVPCKLDPVSNRYNNIDTNLNFIIHPFKQELITLSGKIAYEWIHINYVNNPIKLPFLTEIIHNFGANPRYTDTKGIFHTKAEFGNFLGVINNLNPEYITASFTSYTDDSTSLSTSNKYKSSRMTVGFCLLDIDGKIMNFENNGHVNIQLENSDLRFIQFNNGTLCPPKECGDWEYFYIFNSSN